MTTTMCRSKEKKLNRACLYGQNVLSRIECFGQVFMRDQITDSNSNAAKSNVNMSACPYMSTRNTRNTAGHGHTVHGTPVHDQNVLLAHTRALMTYKSNSLCNCTSTTTTAEIAQP